MHPNPLFSVQSKRSSKLSVAGILIFSLALSATVAVKSESKPKNGFLNPIFQPPAKAAIPIQTVSYQVKVVPDGTPHLEITLSIPVLESDETIKLQLPTWSPGDYHLQNHAKFVQEFHAFAQNPDEEKKELPSTHPDGNTWEIETNGTERVVVTYNIPTTPPGFFSQNVKVEANQVFINGPSAFMYLENHKNWKAELDIFAPKEWGVETSLESSAKKEASSNASFVAPDYDTLADSPIVMGDKSHLKVREFVASGVKHRAVFFGKVENVANPDSFPPVLKKIAEAENKIMGITPYTKYLFLFDVDGDGGGLEHLNSCRIALYSKATPKQFASFFSHEFFHLWNIKRIRPVALGPFDYINPPKTRNLWFAEGVTEYYAHVAVFRAGIATEEQFLNHWKIQINRMGLNPARKKVSGDDASLRVWESGNSQGFGGMSYYDKGELIGLCLDLKIRSLTGGKKSLDDVMRTLMERHNQPKPGYGENEIREVVSKIAGSNLDSFYDTLARSTEEMPFAECLGYAGLKVDGSSIEKPTATQLEIKKGWLGGLEGR